MSKDTGKYRSYSLRLHPETYQMMKKMKEQRDISWNKFIYQLLMEDKR